MKFGAKGSAESAIPEAAKTASFRARAVRRAETYRRSPLTMAVASTTAGTLAVFIVGAVSIQMRASLALQEDRLGLVVAAFFLFAGASSVAGGHLAEWLGALRVMRWAALVSTIGMISIAFLVHSWTELVVALAWSGIGNGLGQPAANVLLAGRVPDETQGFAFGVKQAAIPLATLMGGIAVPAIALTVGWRWAFVCGAAFAVMVERELRIAQRAWREADRPVRRAVRPSTTSLALGRWSSLLLLAVAVCLGAGAANALGVFTVATSVKAGIGHSAAGLLAALGSVCALASRLLMGRAADRRRKGHFTVIATMLVCGGAGYGLLASGNEGLLVPGIVVAFGAGWGWFGLLSYAVVRNYPDAPGRATGVTQMGSFAGGVIGPLVFGVVAQHDSYGSAWAAMAIVALAAAGGMVLGARAVVAKASKSEFAAMMAVGEEEPPAL